ncbi:MAG: bifunctional heptose 7-phosphate kinase/heptose 1-phosphate adenyltransferase [archaeon]
MKALSEVVNQFKEKRVLVIGDIMLDKYFEGDVTRINPEAPVPIVHIKKEFHEIGGAGNVASNIASLGGSATIVSFCGNDSESEILKTLMDGKNIKHLLDNRYDTIQKTRIIGKGQQLLRYDKEIFAEKSFSDQVKQQLIKYASESDIIILSDYAKGAISSELISLISNFKSKIIVDPKPKNKNLYNGVLLIKSNEREALEMAGCSDIYQAGEKLRQELNSNILITHGERGMILFSDKTTEIPTFAKEVYDVTGAGDTVIATLALALATSSPLEEAAIIANHAAGIAVEKKGTYSVSSSELKNKFLSEFKKVISLEELKKQAQDAKRKGRKIVWTNGCFDLLHVGHVRYLQDAKKLGDLLIIGLNSDSSVRALKGPSRPLQSESERAEILSSLEFVDYILIFPESSVEKYLIELNPDIYVKGSDYNLELMDQKERRAVESYCGEFKFVPLTTGKSTSKIIEKIKNGN